MTTSHDPREFNYESAGARLFAVELGEGRPLIFLHGGLADHQASTTQLGALAASHRLIAPDLRGAGRSRHAGPLTWDLLAEDLLALLRHLRLERAAVGGISAGSAVALRLALRAPERVAALVLVAPVFAGAAEGLGDAQRLAMDRMRAAGERALVEGVEALDPLYAALPAPIRARAQAMARRFDPASVAATTRFLAEGAQPFERLEQLATLAMPALVVPGADPEHPAELAARYARTIPRAVVGDPGELVAEVDAFLRAAPP